MVGCVGFFVLFWFLLFGFLFPQKKNVYQLHSSKSFTIYCFVLLPEPRVVSVMVQVAEFDLLLALHYSKSRGVSSQLGAGKVALSELALISLKL